MSETERTETEVLEIEEAEAESASRESSRLAEAAPWLIALLGGIGGVGALGYLRGRYQNSTTYLPDRLPTGVAEVLDHDLETQDVWLETPDGVHLHGWWMKRRDALGTFLYCHGSSGSIAHRVDVFERLLRLRMNVFAFDYRGYGKSEGVPGERGLYTDVRAAYDHVVGPLGQSPLRMILFGHSLGGAVAIDAARDRSVAGLVVEGSFTDIKEMARALYPQLPLHWVARNEFRSIEKVAELDLPKLFIHGTADSTVPFEVGRRLYEAAAEPKELYLVPNAGHNDVHLQGGEEYLRRLWRFVRLCLR